MRRYLLTTATVLAMVASTSAARADMAAAEKWVDSEFQPSTLTRDEQLAELEGFIKAAEPFQGMEINVLRSEELRVGKEWDSTCRSRCAQLHKQKNQTSTTY